MMTPEHFLRCSMNCEGRPAPPRDFLGPVGDEGRLSGVIDLSVDCICCADEAISGCPARSGFGLCFQPERDARLKLFAAVSLQMVSNCMTSRGGSLGSIFSKPDVLQCGLFSTSYFGLHTGVVADVEAGRAAARLR